MPVYTYLVRDRMGKIVRGRMTAVDAKELRKKIDEQDYFLVEFEENKPKKNFLSVEVLSFTPKVSFRDLSVLCWQLYTMLNAGLTLSNTLKIIVKQMRNEHLKNVLNDVGRRIEEGQSFADSLREHPQVFSRFFVQMVNAGEVGGVLDDMLKRLAIFYENQDRVRSRVKSAMMYPLLLLVVSFSVVTFMITYILPKFAQVFKDMGVPLPLPTKMLLHLGFFVQNNWLTIILMVVAFLFAAGIYAGTASGRFKLDQLELKLPIFGELIRKTTASRFTQTLATLISGGIPILTALDVVTETIENTAVVKVIREVTARVGEGKSIAAPLDESKIFPEMVINMIRAGEETGALDKMLDKVAYFYDREVEQAIETFTKLLEPVLIVMMTVVIGFIAVSIFTPIAELMKSLHK